MQRSSLQILAGLLLLTLTVALALGRLSQKRDQRPEDVASSSWTTGTVDVDPIYAAAEAHSRALTAFPTGAYSVTGHVERLVDYDAAYTWSGREFASRHGSSPVWIVGISTVDIPIADLLPLEGAEAEAMSILNTPDVDGAYYFLDANGGYLMGGGALVDVSPQSFASIVAMSNMSLTITPATAFPPIPTSAPTASPTP